jgi:hypothetical protein
MHDGYSLTSPGRTVTVEVVSGGKRLPAYRRADGYPYVPAVPGTAYLIAVRNLTGSHIEVLASADGMNLTREEQASLKSSRGHFIPAHGEYRFAGFRTDDDHSRELVFGTAEGSVAEQATGSTASCGVIGIAVWRELPRITYASAVPASWTADVGAAAAVGEWRGGGTRGLTRSLGTHAGTERHDPVGRTSFERAAGDPDVLVIGYAELAELEAMGITGPADPDPFPRDRATGYRRYAP